VSATEATMLNCRRLAVAQRFIAQVLRRRALGERCPGAPDWIDPGAIESVSAPLPSRDGAAADFGLTLALRDGVPGAAIPLRWRLPGDASGGSLRLLPVRAPRPRTQSAPSITRGQSFGTATALVRDGLAPDRNYLLTCAHVVAPTRDARHGDALGIGGGGRFGTLSEWLPAFGIDAPRSDIDAALLSITSSDALDLRRDPAFLPRDVGAQFSLDLPVTLRRSSTPLAGALKVAWSGYVDIAEVTPGYTDYFLSDAIGYTTVQATIGGDSGAAIWTADERLIGMHIGALPEAGSGGANALFGPIAPVLERFSVQPYLRDDPARLVPRVAPGTVPSPAPIAAGAGAPGVGGADYPLSIVARTLWGEARGEGEDGMTAVAAVIANRVRRRWGGKTDAVGVCLAYKQFSCWNDADPNRAKLDAVLRAPDAAYVLAQTVAARMLRGTNDDPTAGATHYCASGTLPYWARGKQACRRIGRHDFYNNID
jgi:hypothetical protein